MSRPIGWAKPKVKPCRLCGNPVTPTRRKDRNAFWYPRQCSNCFHKSRNPELHKENISKALSGMNHPRARSIGSRRIHNAGCGIHYWLIKVNPIGRWQFEHRYIMSQLLGRELKTIEHVHHKDGNTLDNTPENLLLLNKGQHTILHHSIIRWSIDFDYCIACGKTTSKHVSHGYCSRCYQRLQI